MQTTTAPTLRAYDITVICLGVRYHWYGLYATDWDAIDAMQTCFPQADRIVPRRIPVTVH